MTKKISFLLCLCIVPTLFSKESFVVEPSVDSKHASKNELKEQVGEELKKALETSTSLIDELGKIQQQIASLQKHIVSNVSNLIGNERCFRKASRKTLREALQTMSTITTKLQKQKQKINGMVVQMDKNVCLKACTNERKA